MIIMILTVVIIACGSKEGTVTQEQVDELKEGMTKSEIEETFGAPLEKEENKWIYDLDKDGKIVQLNIGFSGDELLVHSTSPK